MRIKGDRIAWAVFLGCWVLGGLVFFVLHAFLSPACPALLPLSGACSLQARWETFVSSEGKGQFLAVMSIYIGAMFGLFALGRLAARRRKTGRP